MKRVKGPRTPLGKARKRIKELELALWQANNDIAGHIKRAGEGRDKAANHIKLALEYATNRNAPEGVEITPKEMAHALVDAMHPNRTYFRVSLATLREAVRVHVMSEAARRKHSMGRR